MGVPKFYRWLSERYPCLSEVVKEHQIPEFDNLYLDMNGIIHNCSHPNDDDPHFRITEEKIFADIFHYIEVLFRMIQPKKTFFMAIDGVAPRAKMNQQRGRRFRSAKEAELGEKRAKDRGEELPTEARFDSNCITPGTPFMCRLNEQLQYFVTMKISTDSLWQNVTVILSGHETPGEGEHKIMDFIRHAKSKPDYDPNLRHCLYGLDADLMMLGLCTHDPHFSLLREEVRFTGKKTAQKRIITPENTTFHLLHLSLLREYIDHEFGTLRDGGTLDFGYDLESIIDDWILMGFLIGNDFLPHLPHLHINKGALSELFNTYKRVLPQLGGYMNINGKLNLSRFEIFLEALAEKELDRFEDIYSDAKWIEGKTAKKVHGAKAKVVSDTPGPAHVEELLGVEREDQGWEIVSHQKKDSDLVRLLQSANDFLLDSSSEPTDQDELSDDTADSLVRGNMYQIEFRQHKREYYIQKLGYKNVTPEVLREQAEGYVLAIQWNLHYYYDGCVSWSWYYPHHFAPWITDIRDFANMTMTFDKGEPFLPFEQLMSVLPASSKDLIPPTLHVLMMNPNSPIFEYYPENFECDLNGKQQEWEAVVLIPFIEQQKLQDACSGLFTQMTEEEKSRNIHGPMMEYHYTKESLGSYRAPQYFQTIDRNFATCRKVWRSDWEVAIEHLRKGLMEGVRLDVYFPGFPTLKHIPHKARLAKEGVKVFEQNSRGENMMLNILDQGNSDPQAVANELLGQEIWVSWPHMIEAKVISVQSEAQTYSLSKDGRIHVDRTERDEFRKNAHVIYEHYKTRYGILVGETTILLHANVISGRKYVCGKVGKITLEKIWSKTTQLFALQTTRKDILIHDSSFTQYRTLPELYPDGSTCFVMAYALYGCQAEVITIDKEHRGRIQLSVIEPTEPCMVNVKKMEKQFRQHYFPGYKAAQQLGISSHLLSRITGTMFVLKGPKEAEMDSAGKVNIGLNLKNNKKGEEVCGFTRKSQDNNWLYSTKAVDALRSYMSRWPEVFDYLCSSDRINGDYFHETDIFEGGDASEKLKEMGEWIRDQPFYNASRQPVGTLTVDESMVTAIEQTVIELTDSDPKKKKVIMQLKPHLIFKPSLFKGGGAPDQDADYQLFDRVVNVRQGFSVPLGLRGTIIGILKAPRVEDGFVEVLFDQEFHGGMGIRTSAKKCYRVPRTALINISYGCRMQACQQGLPEGHSGQRTKPMTNVGTFEDKKCSGPITIRQNYSNMAKEGSPSSFSSTGAVKHVSPPDPSMLPTPTDFLAATPSSSAAGRDRGHKKSPLKAQNPAFDMNQLWDSLQSNPPPKPQPLLATGAESLNANVQQFFAQAHPPPQVDNVQLQSSAGQATGYGSTNFVPLQVSIKSSNPGKKRGRGSGHGSWMRGRGGGNTSGHQTRDTTNPTSSSSSTAPPRNTGGQQGHHQHKRTRAKLAANFPSEQPD